MAIEQLNAFTFFRSYYEAAAELEPLDRLAFYDVIIKYCFEDEEPDVKGAAKALFLLAKPNLSKSVAKATAGSNGGKANSKQNGSKTEANTKQTLSDKDKGLGDRIKDKDEDKKEDNDGSVQPSEAPKRKEKTIPKTEYAEFVSMTNDEYSSLVAKLGEDGTKRCIEILDNYKGANGKKYASDYRAVMNWVVQRYEEERAKNASDKVTSVSAAVKALEEFYGTQ